MPAKQAHLKYLKFMTSLSMLENSKSTSTPTKEPTVSGKIDEVFEENFMTSAKFSVEIEKIVKDAESHADEDKKFQEMVNAKNQAESLINSTEKSLEELGDKVENEEAEVVNNAIEKLKASLEKEESDVIIADTQALAEAAGKIAEKAYKAAEGDVTQPADAAEGGGDSEKQDENVVDADFEEVKNEKD